jgi:hypothetical protein
MPRRGAIGNARGSARSSGDDTGSPGWPRAMGCIACGHVRSQADRVRGRGCGHLYSTAVPAPAVSFV